MKALRTEDSLTEIKYAQGFLKALDPFFDGSLIQELKEKR